jgi:DNA polymerase III alpha subunit
MRDEKLRDRFLKICVAALKSKGIDDDPHRKRLKEELKDLFAKEEHTYLLDLYDQGMQFEFNENNVLVVELLDLAPGFDINSPADFEVGDWPDVDIDYLKEVRDYLKNEWAPIFYGREKVCNIGSYNTFGIKSALIDMARIHGLERNEIVSLTKNLIAKDEDGNPITWETVLAINKGLKEYCDKYPEVAEAARRLMNRNRGRGTHAAGLIVSSKRLDDLVPLIVDDKKNIVSAWTEGLSAQELGPMGLVKFDCLVITNNNQVARAVQSVKKRHGIELISALPDTKEDWSDISYLNDPKVIALANDARLKGIFQFDSPGIRGLVTKGGVKDFDDLVAYTALYRPGCLQTGMADAYVKRAKGERYEIHPLLEPILGNTYNVMVFQEQIMKVLNVVGNIPLKDCEGIRKAISKKKLEKFIKYKELFIENGQGNLGQTREELEDLWGQIESFADYGFNKAHGVAYTYLSSRLLYLKTHYPLEFFEGILHFEVDPEKLKEYKIDAAAFNVEVMPPHFNKSKVRCELYEDDDGRTKIYMGLSNIKGIGVKAAQKIVDGQPYADFEDLLERFGTDASVVPRLIALRLFGDDDLYKLYRYFEHYKNIQEKRDARRKRYEGKQEEWVERIEAEEDKEKRAEFLAKKNKSTEGFLKKEEYSDANPPTLEAFNEEFYIEDKVRAVLDDIEEAERQFYGFRWVSPLTLSPDYKGDMTFERHRYEVENNDAIAAPVELEILECIEKTARTGKKYRQIKGADGNDEVAWINVWLSDWERWKEELFAGNLIRMRAKPPKHPYPTYSIDSVPKHIGKEEDYRIKVLEKGKSRNKERPKSDEEILESIKNGR